MTDEFVYILPFGLAILVCAFLWIYALISALKNERLDPTMKLVWVVVIILVSGLGAIIYLFVAPNRPGSRERTLVEWEERNRRRR
jgi:Phospholipase_D-nuclease N-terminal